MGRKKERDRGGGRLFVFFLTREEKNNKGVFEDEFLSPSVLNYKDVSKRIKRNICMMSVAH